MALAEEDRWLKSFTYEHLYPVREIRTTLATASTISEALQVLDRMLWVAWITKEEDKRLHELGFGSIRPDPLRAYEQAGIKLVPDQPRPTTDANDRRCASLEDLERGL